MDNTQLKQYEDWKFKVSAYEMALNIIETDKATVAPMGGLNYRDQRTAFLSGELFSLITDEKIITLLKAIKDEEELPYETRREASLYYKNAYDLCSIPKQEYVEFQNVLQESYGAWLTAKKNNNYPGYAPYLKKIIAYKKKFYGYRDSDLPVYDQMLDDYEPGMHQREYDAFFATIKEHVIPLVQKVVKAQPIDDSFLQQSFDTKVQKQFTEEVLLPYLHFDKEWGYQNETEHPFTSFTCENDCRTTTKYVENNLLSAMFSTIHETGHAWYMHDVDPKYDGSILSFGISSGMHESQSRFCENYLARRTSFWSYNYPKLQHYFPSQLKDISLERFMKAANASKPSLVRTEADELTYPLHILIRYELEKGIFNETMDVENLENLWNEKYREYLGVDVPNASQGILQDVHWSAGDMGYFPTYALGSAFGAQFVHAMEQDLDIDTLLSSGNYMACMEWLKEHIHRYGALYNADEMVKIATKEPFNPKYYTDYLEEKYSKLYAL